MVIQSIGFVTYSRWCRWWGRRACRWT